MAHARRHAPNLQSGDHPRQKHRAPVSFNSLGVLFLAAVIVLASTPAALATSLNDPAGPISRVGSQIRRIAAAVPVRLVSRAPRHDQQRPIDARPGADRLALHASRVLDAARAFAGPAVARLGVHFTDLPPPARGA